MGCSITISTGSTAAHRFPLSFFWSFYAALRVRSGKSKSINKNPRPTKNNGPNNRLEARTALPCRIASEKKETAFQKKIMYVEEQPSSQSSVLKNLSTSKQNSHPRFHLISPDLTLYRTDNEVVVAPLPPSGLPLGYRGRIDAGGAY